MDKEKRKEVEKVVCDICQELGSVCDIDKSECMYINDFADRIVAIFEEKPRCKKRK